MKINWNFKNIEKINENTKLALVDTAESIKTDLIQSQTMPKDTGHMQNDSTFGKEGTSIDTRKKINGVVKIVVDTPYARKVYFDPEIHIKQGENPNAKQYWFEDYISGNKKDLPIKHLKKHLQRRMKS